MRGSAGPLRLRFRVGAAIAAHRLWGPGDRVCVALSGGRDSVCLLDLLCATARWHGGELSAITVDHGTRPGSAADADFAEELARARGLPIHRVDLALGSDASEATARAHRLGAFDELDVDAVATAHHRDDLVETLLLHLLRGAGTRGLAGMRWRRGRLVRPLLAVSGDELEAWAEARGLAWRTDPTNANSKFLRNRVRSELLPLLEHLRPGATSAVARAAAHAADDDHHLAELARSEVSEGAPLAASWVAEAPAALVRRVLARRMPDAESTHLDALVACARRGSGRVVTGMWAAEVRGGRVHIGHRA